MEKDGQILHVSDVSDPESRASLHVGCCGQGHRHDCHLPFSAHQDDDASGQGSPAQGKVPQRGEPTRDSGSTVSRYWLCLDEECPASRTVVHDQRSDRIVCGEDFQDIDENDEEAKWAPQARSHLWPAIAFLVAKSSWNLVMVMVMVTAHIYLHVQILRMIFSSCRRVHGPLWEFKITKKQT
mmetsp:Transcript_7494/g.13489  ORF Transcript_7494/g.13489 Transcript_7494/m.13489 type:complete len:182 (-) Transcript_7494:35-580(-)